MRLNPPGRMLKNFNRLRKYGLYSPTICLEASSACQLRCPCCIHTTCDTGTVKFGFLRFENFKWFVENYPEFERIELSCWGEPFLNPEMDEIIAFAHAKGVALTTAAGTNFNSISKETIENLVKYQFHHITVALDGASPEVYQTYRRGGDFDTVINNVKLLNAFKKQYGSSRPDLRWQFVVFGHNEHEIGQAERMASELNMKFALKLNGRHGYAPVQNKELLRSRIGAATPREYWLRKKKLYLMGCSSMWLGPQISWDGNLMGCCQNKWGHYGNVFESGLEACLRSEEYQYARRMLTGRAEPREDIPCSSCANCRNKLREGPLYPRPGLYEFAVAVMKR